MSTDRLTAAMARLRAHPVHYQIATEKLREVARLLEGLAENAAGNAESATAAALGPEGPPTPEFNRRQTWPDRARLLDRSAAMGEAASAIRCALKGQP